MKTTRHTGVDHLRQLAAEVPESLVRARQDLSDVRQREREAKAALEDANQIDNNPARRELARTEALADVYDAQNARVDAEREVVRLAQPWWQQHEATMKEALIPLVAAFDRTLRAAERANDELREAEALLRGARPKEAPNLAQGYGLFWREFPFPGQATPSRLTSWRAYVQQELGVEL